MAFKINEFRFLSDDEKFIDLSFVNWSRPYEWGYVLKTLKDLPLGTVHNTCCGLGPLHLQFHRALEETGHNVIHSDMFVKETRGNYFKWNTLDKLPPTVKYTYVLCISTLEEMGKTNIVKALEALISQTASGGRLIITCDYPDVPLEILENYFKIKCKDVPNRLNGDNSKCRNPGYKHLNIILIDLTIT